MRLRKIEAPGGEEVLVAAGKAVGLWWVQRDTSHWIPIATEYRNRYAEDVCASLQHHQIAWGDTEGFHLVDLNTQQEISTRNLGERVLIFFYFSFILSFFF